MVNKPIDLDLEVYKTSILERGGRYGDVSESHKGSNVQENIEVHSAASFQTNEVTVSKIIVSFGNSGYHVGRDWKPT